MINVRVTKLFSEVPNLGTMIPSHIDNPFKGKGGVLHKIVSVKDENIMYVTWPIPNQKKSKSTKHRRLQEEG